MTSERWKRVNDLFQSALDREGAEREAFLADACADDAALRAEVRSLLEAHGRAGVFIDAPAGALAAGSRLGAYEVVGLLGAGGMGEVYRARDTRLGRDVAIKVLPPGLSRDPDRLRRFEQEARAAGMLNHPNILAIHDVGRHADAPYVVSELLEGETLRERQGGAALPVRKALDYGVQIAHGLAAAHEKGIVHRDLKPENLFVTRDGRIKILDFGLAKLVAPVTAAPGDAGPLSVTEEATQPGMLLGTIGYMSPEQVRAENATPESDIFSFGAILYEMLAGRRAFAAGTALETMRAILTDEPADIASARNVPPSLERIVRRCLEKRPEERFHSARDLAFALETLAPTSEPRTASIRDPSPARGVWRRLPALLALLALATAVFVTGMRMGETPIPSFRQITFRRGTVESARFSPDGNSVLYGAAWEGSRSEIFTARLDGVESRSMGLGGALLLATVPGEMAVLLRAREKGGVLARLPLEGGTVREVLEDVRDADWTRDGRHFALVRGVTGRTRLEFPAGKVVYETVGNIASARVSPGGDRVAFFDQPMLGNTPGSVVVVDREGRKRVLSEGWTDVGGLAWVPAGGEVWFSAARTGNARTLHAVSLSGRYRLLARTPGTVILQDISPAGRVLLTHANQRSEALARFSGEVLERDLSWYDWTHATDFTADGRGLLFTAEGEGAGPLYTVYLRRTLEAPPVRLGEGHSTELSPDGGFALTMLRSSPPRLLLLPTGPGEPRTLPSEKGIVEYHWAWWFPDGKRILFLGNKAGRPAQLFVQDVPDGRPRALAPEGVTAYRNKPISPDGRLVVALAPGDPGPRFVLWPVEGGEPRRLPTLEPRDQPVRWSADGRFLFVRDPGTSLPVRIDRMELATGRRTPWKELGPMDPAGVETIGDILLRPDGESWILSCRRVLSELYVVDGLK